MLMVTTDTIHIEVDGDLVVGEITARTAGDIVISITRPYRNLTSSAHLPVMARPKIDYTGPHGNERAYEMLLELYRLGRFLDTNLRFLRRAYAEYFEEVRDFTAEMPIREAYHVKRSQLKRSLTDGLIDQTTYQYALGRLRGSKEKAAHVTEVQWLTFLHEQIPSAAAAEPDEIRAILADEVELVPDPTP
jgi:hypothetical protein